ncbi:Cloroperoxidase [Durotheca rogersii]|uniref:Cloroperoxidase n=1 Tax=Durotheca rogersii TaxID=419775 RepID=UPI00221FE06D|nr:Cloroperoxidase [Durotheca rogersii]KAI5859425.1 Cloroperoxidase [Durotheca rogersii]
MNTLANHGYLPHDGRNVTEQVVVNAMESALNFEEPLGWLMFRMAVFADPEPNATFFTLDHLNVHNVLEHDASLSRTDAAFGYNHIFNQTIFNQTRVYWTGEILDADMLANSKVARQLHSKAFNPDHTFTPTIENFSLGEVSAPIVAFGDFPSVTVNRTLVEYFLRNIRDSPVTLLDIFTLMQAIHNASSLLTGTESAAPSRRQNLHAGIFA